MIELSQLLIAISLWCGGYGILNGAACRDHVIDCVQRISLIDHDREKKVIECFQKR